MKLMYFDVRGVVEVARYMLHMGGAEYEDFRYPIDTSTFAKPVSPHAREPRGGLRTLPRCARKPAMLGCGLPARRLGCRACSTCRATG